MPNPISDSEPDDERFEALARYLAGESTAAEADAVRRWLEESGSRQEEVSALDRALDHLAFTPPVDLDVEGALARVKERADAVPSASTVEMDTPVAPIADAPRRSRVVPGRRLGAPVAVPPARRRSTPILAAAAAVGLLIGGVVVTRRLHRDAAPAPLAPAHSFASSVGARDSVRLADSTLVVLGPSSRLEVAAGYGADGRDVALHGEAYFDVRRDSVHPFTVHAGDASIRDVGTVFVVHADTGMPVRVAVREGAVHIARMTVAGDSGLVLRAGDVGVLPLVGEITARRGVPTDGDLAWMRGELVFDDATLADVGADLRRWYGLTLVVPDSMRERRFSSTYRGEPVSRVLGDLGVALGARIEQRGDSAFVRAGPPFPPPRR